MSQVSESKKNSEARSYNMTEQFLTGTFNSIRCYKLWLTNEDTYTVKPVLSDHSKIDKTKILMTNGSLMKVESIAEPLEHSAILLTCIKR